MTQRKPLGLKFGSWIEHQIRSAQVSGDFENLPGEGKPDPNVKLSADPAWWAKKLMRREGVGFLPPALALRREVESALHALEKLDDEGRVRARIQRLNARIRRANAISMTGPATSLAPLDEEAAVERWRSRKRS